MKLNFKNRIALHYMLVTAILMATAFGLVYLMVESTVYKHLDSDLSYEATKHLDEVEWYGDSIRFINKAEWEEREHREAQVNPVFLQIINQQGHLMDKSPNLKEASLPFKLDEKNDYFDAQLQGKSIRQAQIVIEKEGKVRGYILAAMSSESSQAVIHQLRKVLLVSYCFILIGLYFTSRFLAGRSIEPVKTITETVKKIGQRNLSERVSLPQHKDELYDLSVRFNELLDRIEQAMERERQFTSDASHELRTPLTTLRGTLEILIRKPRSQEEYEEKVKYALFEIDRMTGIVEQLLLLARLDNKQALAGKQQMPIALLIDEILSAHGQTIQAKGLQVIFQNDLVGDGPVPTYYGKLILDNLISNAIKYTKPDSDIHIEIFQEAGGLFCAIRDEGIGIAPEDIEHIFQRFFRSKPLEHKGIDGNGLGLAIAKKAADSIHANISVSSQRGVGTSMKVCFPQS